MRGQRRWATIVNALVTGPAWTNLLVLLGMVWAIGSVGWLLSRPVAADSTVTGRSRWRNRTPPARLALWGPQVLIGTGFWLSRSTDTLWVLAVVGAVAALCGFALHMLGRSADRDTGVDPPILATLLATTVLVELGALLAVRLVVVPDPDVAFGGGMSEDAWAAGWHALVQPLLGIAGVLVLIWLAADAPIGRMAALRGLAALRGWSARLAGRAYGVPGSAQPIRGARAVAATAVGVLLVLTPFLLPLFGGGDDSEPAGLTFLGVATPEFGKLLFLPALAVVVARNSHRVDGDQSLRLLVSLNREHRFGWLRAGYLTLRFALYPLALFALVALASGLRHDFGTLISVLAATIAVTLAATRHYVGELPDAGHGSLLPRLGRQFVRTISAYRVFLGAGAALLAITAVVALVFTDYVHERAQVWGDPWVYRWAAGCVPPDTAPPVPAAHGVSLCQRSLAADAESERAQVAIVLSAVADGGLWGHGLRDTVSGQVPAGPTDFILAVMWNKLGAVVVLAAAVLVILLGTALRRSIPSSADRAGVGLSPAALFATGLAAMIVGQFLFVFAATVNIVPHSGIPAPFLSRGGQSTFALLLGVTAVLFLATAAPTGRGGPGPAYSGPGYPARPGTPRTAPPVTIGRAGWTGVATVIPVVFCLAATAIITLRPYPAPLPTDGWFFASYDQKRPPCPARGPDRAGLISPQPDPSRCSTDRIAYNRTRVEVRFGTAPGLLQRRPSGEWELASGADLGGLTMADLAGVLRVGQGDIGVVDQSYPQVVDGTAGTDLARRLAPAAGSPRVDGGSPRVDGGSPRVDGGLSLTLNPKWQHAAATALRTGAGNGVGPLAGGVVVLDPRTGRVLVIASAPDEEPNAPVSGPVKVDGPTRAFLADHPEYTQLGTGDSLDGSVPDSTCQREGSAVDRQRACWRWSADAVPAPPASADPRLRRYVENDPTVDVPLPAVNRALGHWYGLGSTFKVVIAAAYVSSGGSAQDLLPAPDSLRLAPGVVIRNAGGGQCPGVEDGMISLTRALAVSCNTAFVALARQLGWPRIAEQAARFGFHVGPCQDARAWLTNELSGAVASCVPADVDGVAIGNSALGGQDVQGTPLQMATVLGAVANHGRAVQPTVVDSVTPPGTGRTLRTPPGQVQVAVDPAADEELTAALSRTAVDGTAAGLQAAVPARLWVKTGTHEVVPAGSPLPPHQFVRQDAWLTGFLDTPTGPVAFAAVVETRDEKAGATQVRFVVQALCRAILESR